MFNPAHKWHKENQTKYRGLSVKPRRRARILIYRMWVILITMYKYYMGFLVFEKNQSEMVL